MSDIPPDIYERVRELAIAIVNASEAGDTALHESHCQALFAYYKQQEQLGRSHPFLTEAVADFTSDPVAAVRFYDLSLKQARAYPGEPLHTKMIALAERLLELGRTEQAGAYLRDGRAEAVRCGDNGWVKEADELLQEYDGRDT